jgi:hypothetical protein
MTTDDKILKILGALTDNVATVLEEQQAQRTDIRYIQREMATKQDLEEVRTEMATKTDIEEVRNEIVDLKIEMHDIKVSLTKKVNSHEKRIDNLEKHTGIPNPDKN